MKKRRERKKKFEIHPSAPYERKIIFILCQTYLHDTIIVIGEPSRRFFRPSSRYESMNKQKRERSEGGKENSKYIRRLVRDSIPAKKHGSRLKNLSQIQPSIMNNYTKLDPSLSRRQLHPWGRKIISIPTSSFLPPITMNKTESLFSIRIDERTVEKRKIRNALRLVRKSMKNETENNFHSTPNFLLSK